MQRASVSRQVAIGDLVLFSALAVPGLGGWLLDSLVALGYVLGLGGTWQPTPSLYLLVHLMGVMGAALAYLRLQLPASARGCAVAAAVKLYAASLFVLFVYLGAPSVFLLLAGVDAVQGARLLAARHRD